MLKAITVIAGRYDGRRKRIEYVHLTDTLNEAILRMRLEGSTYDFASIELQENDLTFVIDRAHRISRAQAVVYHGVDRRQRVSDRRQVGTVDRRRTDQSLFRKTFMGSHDDEGIIDRRRERSDRRYDTVTMVV